MEETIRLVRQDILIHSPLQPVFEAWANPAELSHWYVDRAEGDPRKDRRITWFVEGSGELLQTMQCEPPRRLMLTNVGSGPWSGTVVDVDLRPEVRDTRLTLLQSGFSVELREHIPNVHTGWGCMLAILKEYVEHHLGNPRRQIQSAREWCPANAPTRWAPDPGNVAAAFASPESITQWAQQAPSHVLGSFPRGCVFGLKGFPGVFLVMGVGAVSVRYQTWVGDDLQAAKQKADLLADGLLAQLQRP